MLSLWSECQQPLEEANRWNYENLKGREPTVKQHSCEPGRSGIGEAGKGGTGQVQQSMRHTSQHTSLLHSIVCVNLSTSHNRHGSQVGAANLYHPDSSSAAVVAGAEWFVSWKQIGKFKSWLTQLRTAWKSQYYQYFTLWKLVVAI